MALPLPAGVYYVYYQPEETQLYLTLDQNSVPTVDLLSRGSRNQQWQVSPGPSDANSRTLRNVQFETYIGRSFIANQNGTLAVVTPIPWYMKGSEFGPGWWRISANPNDSGPWWVIEKNSSGIPVVQVSSSWMVFFFLDVSIVDDPKSSTSSFPTSISIPTSFSTSNPSLSTSPSSPSISSSGSPGGLSSGDIAALASSIPIGIIGLILAALSVWYARKQYLAGKPVLRTFRDDVARFVRQNSHGDERPKFRRRTLGASL